MKKRSGTTLLIIDTELRRPHMTEVFSLKKSKGFTDILSTTFNRRLSRGKSLWLKRK